MVSARPSRDYISNTWQTERESPVFKEAVKITLTPLISSLSILNYIDMNSEVSVLGYEISLIMLNLGMCFVAPVVVIHTIRKKL